MYVHVVGIYRLHGYSVTLSLPDCMGVHVAHVGIPHPVTLSLCGSMYVPSLFIHPYQNGCLSSVHVHGSDTEHILFLVAQEHAQLVAQAGFSVLVACPRPLAMNIEDQSGIPGCR